MLYSKERHSFFSTATWDESLARCEIEAIVRETEASFTLHGWWPAHPLDEHPAYSPSDKTLYLGAAGVMWALEYLAAQKTVMLSRSYRELWYEAWRDYQSVPDTGEIVPSWFLGQTPLLLLTMLRGSQAHRAIMATRLHEAVAGNIANPTWEILWGSPGTMLAALFAYESTKEQRWLDLYHRNADRLWQEWTYNEELGCDVWTQDLYGKKLVYLGAAHGFAGNAFALLRGIETFSERRKQQLLSNVAHTTKRLARRENGFANWPAAAVTNSGQNKGLLQWCHGAPGFLLAVAGRFPVGVDHELDQLFLQAGELIWRAGPLHKGACFCHGTDGNGMALLTLYKRTGDAMWLERAKCFAMHALRQSRQNAEKYGRRRYTLWTGDLGLALFLQACIDQKPHMPALDFV